MKDHLISAVPLLTLALLLFHPASASPSRDTLVGALETRYQVAKTGLNRGKVTAAGTVFTVQKDGLSAAAAGGFVNVNNTVANGAVEQHGGRFGSLMKSSVVKNERPLAVGEKVYVVKFEAKAESKNDVLRVQLVTCDPSDAGGEQKLFAADVLFKFPKNYLDKATPEEVAQAVEAFLAPDAQQPAAPAPTDTTAAAPPSVPPAPPAPPAAQSGPTVTMNMTTDEVVAAMGPPSKIVDLGATKKYIYKDMKITFVNGRVTDVQ